MHGLTLLSVVLLALSTLATAESHIHRVSHRGVHRRHHARSQGSAASGQPRRRACPVNSTSSAAPASSSVPANTLIAVPSSTGAAASSSAAPTSTATASDDQPTTTSKASASSSKAASSSSSATSSSSSAAATASSTDKGVATELVGKLFPVSNAIASWSTASSALEKGTALALSDATLRTTRVLSGTTHTYMQWEGKSAMRAVYPAGSYNFQHTPRGGFSWYGYGPASVDLTTAREVTLAYSVYFEKGFQFVLGGKLPGLYGGDSDDGAISCSGGDRDDKCWSSRLMWRTPTNGVAAGELYTYLPPSPAANTKVCNIAPKSDCNPTYGASVGRGAYTIPSGQWVTLAQRVRLNDVGQSNGAIEVYVNGRSVISASGIVLRTSSAGRIRGIMGQTFFGGSTTAWASPKDQNSYFADFSVAITEKL